MTQEKKQEFTRRLSCCNRGEMVVIMYDILYAYLEDAEGARAAGDYEGFKQAARNAQQVMRRLMEDLDFSYPIAGELHEEYRYAAYLLEMAVCKYTEQAISDVRRVMDPLYEGFRGAAAQDASEPLMQHTQQVVAGMTYGKGSLNETVEGSESSRGFLA